MSVEPEAFRDPSGEKTEDAVPGVKGNALSAELG